MKSEFAKAYPRFTALVLASMAPMLSVVLIEIDKTDGFSIQI